MKHIELWETEKIMLEVPPSKSHRTIEVTFKKSKGPRKVSLSIKADPTVKIDHIKTYPENFKPQFQPTPPKPNIES